MTRVTILGGGGFIGSRIAAACVAGGHRVSVVDGFLDGTTGRRANLAAFAGTIELIDQPVEEATGLDAMLAASDAVVDCMGWTRHRAALADPRRDLELNLASHVHWLRRLPDGARPRVIYLGSRTQFTDPPGGADIAEDAPQEPADVQGIHKAAAEQHVRLAARLRGFPAIALRLPACIGRHQETDGDDIGLVGGFARELLAGRPVLVYGAGRQRAVVFVDDVAAIVCRLLDLRTQGFVAFNQRGHVLSIEELARRLAAIIGRGRVETAPLPPEIAAIDSGAAAFREDRLRAAIGPVPCTPLDVALSATVRWLESALA